MVPLVWHLTRETHYKVAISVLSLNRNHLEMTIDAYRNQNPNKQTDTQWHNSSSSSCKSSIRPVTVEAMSAFDVWFYYQCVNCVQCVSTVNTYTYPLLFDLMSATRPVHRFVLSI